MPVILDDAAAAIALGSAGVSLLSGCVKGLTLLSRARGYGQEAAGIKLLFELERHKLQEWATAAGLLETPVQARTSSQNDKLVADVLMQMNECLSSLFKMRKHYGLDLMETDEDLDDSEYGAAAVEDTGNLLRRKFVSKQAGVLHKKEQPLEEA